MDAAELRAITAQGPAVILSSKEDMLALLDEVDALRWTVLCLLVALRVDRPPDPAK